MTKSPIKRAVHGCLCIVYRQLLLVESRLYRFYLIYKAQHKMIRFVNYKLRIVISIITLLLFNFSSNATTCSYEIHMEDDYGDGWDGEVKIEKDCGSGWVDVTAWQSEAGFGPTIISFSVDDADGCSYRLTYRDNAGWYPYEEFFVLYDANGSIVIDGNGADASSQNILFTPSCAAPTCNDGIQNQGETGVDCGGPCPACAVVNSCTALGLDDVTSTFTGSHSVWTIYKGKNDVDNSFTVDPTISTDVINDNKFSSYADLRPGSNPHGSSFDYWNSAGILIPVPNGSTNVIRLGAYQEGFSEAHGMICTFTVSDSYLKFHYILGFEETGGSHALNEKGFCSFKVRDASNNLLPCSFDIYENDPSETWTHDNSVNPVYLMSSWNSVTIDVSSYIGQNLTIEVWTADCTEGAHPGYGYFDFECLSSASLPCNTALPVDLVEFKATCIGQKPMLTWTTSSETNNDYFSILRSEDGIDYMEVHKEYSLGNSSTFNQYSWIDANANGDQSYYYKIDQTDYDGATESYSPKFVEACSREVIISYNSSSNQIQFKNGQYEELIIYNTLGQIVYKRIIGPFSFNITIPNLSNGIYSALVYNRSGESDSISFVIE